MVLKNSLASDFITNAMRGLVEAGGADEQAARLKHPTTQSKNNLLRNLITFSPTEKTTARYPTLLAKSTCGHPRLRPHSPTSPCVGCRN
jgi:hypothetical protein